VVFALSIPQPEIGTISTGTKTLVGDVIKKCGRCMNIGSFIYVGISTNFTKNKQQNSSCNRPKQLLHVCARDMSVCWNGIFF
jgi:hypothetical protein